MKPMLACPVLREDYDKIIYPVIASPKVDGIRGLMIGGRLMSRGELEIPNEWIQSRLREAQNSCLFDGLDGEIITFNSKGLMDNFNDVQSKVMSREGKPDFKWMVFDSFMEPMRRYSDRVQSIRITKVTSRYADLLHRKNITCREKLEEYIEMALSNGFEGVCIRNPNSPYKFNRSTFREQGLLKIKPMEDMEGEIVDSIALVREDGTVEDLLGAWVVRTHKHGEFKIGSGFTADQRKEFWESRERLKGLTITFKYQAFGTKDKPRCPIYKCFRYVHH